MMNGKGSIAETVRTAICTLSVFPALAAVSYGQSNVPVRPTPTPTPDDLPEVVSRDADIEKMIRERTTDVPAEVSVEDPAGSRQDGRKLALDSLTVTQQQKLLLYLDILTKLEQRAENLRSQMISLTEKENEVTTKLQQLEYSLRPEVIESSTALSGSLRPESIREQRKSDLEIEKSNMENLLSQIEASRASLESNLRRADEMAEKMRVRFEAVLDAALSEENP